MKYYQEQYRSLELQNIEETETIKDQLRQIKSLQKELETQEVEFQEWMVNMEQNLNSHHQSTGKLV